MGFDRLSVEFLLHEHRHRPIKGRLLTIGRQTVGFTPDQAIALIEETGTPILARSRREIDRRTVHAHSDRDFISDEAFFGLFCDATLAALDVTDYEGAEYVHDMGLPVPSDLEEQFDFIVNGSCLDNIFDPATAIKNVSKMLKPGGRTLHFEWGNAHASAYLKYSPDWFMDYYAVNNFADCKVYVINFPNSIDTGMDGSQRPGWAPRRPYSVEAWRFDPIVVYSGQVGYECSFIDIFTRYLVLVIAEKAADSSADVSPVQKHYRGPPEAHRPYIEAAQRFAAFPRPFFSNGRPVPEVEPISPYPTLRCIAVW